MALQFRTIDGSQNNPEDPSINQANTDFVRVAPANFADGFNAMQPGPNAREISNIVVANNPDTHLEVDGVALSGMMYAWVSSSITIWIWRRVEPTRMISPFPCLREMRCRQTPSFR